VGEDALAKGKDSCTSLEEACRGNKGRLRWVGFADCFMDHLPLGEVG
jgi:hypothetical protein